MKEELEMLKEKTEALKLLLARTNVNAAYVYSLDGKELETTLSDMGAKLALLHDESGDVGSIFEFTLSLEQREGDRTPILHFSRLGADYTMELGESAQGNSVRLKNFFKRFSSRIEDIKEEMQKVADRISDLETELKKPFQYPKEIKRCEREAQKIRDSLGLHYK